VEKGTSAKPGTHYRYYGPLQTTTDHYGPLYCLWSGPGFADVAMSFTRRFANNLEKENAQALLKKGIKMTGEDIDMYVVQFEELV